jgi:hypothetical protein
VSVRFLVIVAAVGTLLGVLFFDLSWLEALGGAVLTVILLIIAAASGVRAEH